MLFFGASAIAGKLMGLDNHQFSNAFGLALHQMAGTKQSMRDLSHGFKLGQGLAARGGIFSAELAQRGVRGVKDPFLSSSGDFKLYCQTYDVESLTRDLGRIYYADTTFNRYPCCSENTAVLDGTLELIRNNIVVPEEVQEVVVCVPETMRQSLVVQPFAIGEVPAMSAAYSMAYVVASTLVRGEIRPDHFSESFIREARVLDLVKKVTIGFLPREEPSEAIVKIRIKNGREFSCRVDVASIDPVRRGLSKEEIRQEIQNECCLSKEPFGGKY